MRQGLQGDNTSEKNPRRRIPRCHGLRPSPRLTLSRSSRWPVVGARATVPATHRQQVQGQPGQTCPGGGTGLAAMILAGASFTPCIRKSLGKLVSRFGHVSCF